MLTVGVIGLGLIGGSLAMALQDHAQDLLVLGTDVDDATTTRAQEMGVIDGLIREMDVSSCDIIFVCSPLPAIPRVLTAICPTLKPGAVVTDVGSVKAQVMSWFTQYLPSGVIGIGGHPMAGSDKSGITAADSHLFENAVWILTPPADGTEAPITTLIQTLAGTGAAIRIMPAEMHDEAVSRVSHLPHLTAACLVNSLDRGEEYLGLAGGGLRDTTRIASSNPELWADILLSNRDKVVMGIDSLLEKLIEMRHTLSNGLRSDLVDQLQSARSIRSRIPQRRESLLQSVDVIAIVPDQPGIIGRLGWLLGDAGININDIQVLGVRDEDEGSLRLALPENQARQAVEILCKNGIRAWIRD